MDNGTLWARLPRKGEKTEAFKLKLDGTKAPEMVVIKKEIKSSSKKGKSSAVKETNVTNTKSKNVKSKAEVPIHERTTAKPPPSEDEEDSDFYEEEDPINTAIRERKEAGTVLSKVQRPMRIKGENRSIKMELQGKSRPDFTPAKP